MHTCTCVYCSWFKLQIYKVRCCFGMPEVPSLAYRPVQASNSQSSNLQVDTVSCCLDICITPATEQTERRPHCARCMHQVLSVYCLKRPVTITRTSQRVHSQVANFSKISVKVVPVCNVYLVLHNVVCTLYTCAMCNKARNA